MCVCHVVLRGDLPRLARSTSIVTSTPSSTSTSEITNVKRSKPLKYAYEKEIVLYAHHKKLDYFSTECIYSPEAFRGSARTLIKNLERIRPSSILDVVKSGEDMAKLVSGTGDSACNGRCGRSDHIANEVAEDAAKGGCGREEGQGGDEEMRDMERRLEASEQAQSEGREIDVTSNTLRGQNHDRNKSVAIGTLGEKDDATASGVLNGQRHDRDAANGLSKGVSKGKSKMKGPHTTPRKMPQQKMGQCERCGYLTSQPICKACMLLEGLNKNRPKTAVAIGLDDEEGGAERMQKGIEGLAIAEG